MLHLGRPCILAGGLCNPGSQIASVCYSSFVFLPPPSLEIGLGRECYAAFIRHVLIQGHFLCNNLYVEAYYGSLSENAVRDNLQGKF